MFDQLVQGAMADGYSETRAKIFAHVFMDKPTSDIAKIMNRDEKNLRSHIQNIYKEYGVKTRVQLILKCAPYLRGERVLQ